MNQIISSILTGLFAVFIFMIVTNLVWAKQRFWYLLNFRPKGESESFGIVNKWVILSFVLYTFGFMKHQLGYYLTIDPNYCKQTEICDKLMKQTKPGIIDNAKGYLSFVQSVWIESVGEGLLFVCVGLPLFLFFNNKIIAAFFTGILANLVAEYSGIHNYFCKKTCSVNPLSISSQS